MNKHRKYMANFKNRIYETLRKIANCIEKDRKEKRKLKNIK